MYNGIGLPTPRGSGTSGYIQRNLSHVHVKKRALDTGSPVKSIRDKKENVAITKHEEKRKIELELVELREQLEEENKLTPEEIETVISKRREKLQGKKRRCDEETEQWWEKRARRGQRRRRPSVDHREIHSISPK